MDTSIEKALLDAPSALRSVLDEMKEEMKKEVKTEVKEEKEEVWSPVLEDGYEVVEEAG